MKKNNILFLSYDFPPRCRWGVARHVEALSSGMLKHFDVDIATKSENKKSIATIFSSSLLDDNFTKSKFLPLDSYVDFEYLLSWNYLFAKKIISEYKKKNKRPDIIHNHNWMTFPAALKIKKYFNSKIVSSLHFLEKQYVGLQEVTTEVDFLDILKIENSIMRESDILIVFGENHKNFVIENYKPNKNKIRVIPHGIDLSKFKSYKSNPINYNKNLNINFVGRLVKEKGVLELISVINDLGKQFPFIKLNLIGEGPLESEISPNSFINSCGFLNNIEVLKMNKNANIFCLPSYTETFGYATLESMACGLPIIISAGKKVEKILNKDEALFVDVNYSNPVSIDTQKLKKNLYLLISSESERQKYANKSLSAAKRYSLNNMILKTKKVYEEVLTF